MAKETIDKNIQSIRKLIGTKKLIVGTEKTLKALKLGKIDKVYMASNCEEFVEKRINHYGNLKKVSLVKLDCPNDELGTLCKKPFSISVISLIKEKTK
jgi:large subunit ribosomal protein L30e